MAENAANVAHPAHIAWGPARAASAPPVKQPAYTLLYMSCFARAFSMTHSEPAKTAPTAPKPFAYVLRTPAPGRSTHLAAHTACQYVCLRCFSESGLHHSSLWQWFTHTLRDRMFDTICRATCRTVCFSGAAMLLSSPTPCEIRRVVRRQGDCLSPICATIWSTSQNRRPVAV